MSWWKRPKLAMPLPAADNYPQDRINMPGTTLRQMDLDITQDTANNVSKQHPDLSFIDNGQYGAAYTTSNPNTVVKITRDRTEFIAAQRLMKTPSPCIVGVKSAVEIQGPNEYDPDTEHYYKLELERVQPLSKQDRGVVDELVYYVAYGRIKTLEYILKQKVAGMEWRDPPPTQEQYATMTQNITRLYGPYQQMLNCINAAGFSPNDCHGNNVGWTTDGRMVLLDLGGISKEETVQQPAPVPQWTSKDDELLKQLQAGNWFSRLKFAVRMWDGWIDDRGQLIPVQYGETHSTCAVRAIRERGENVPEAKSELDYTAPYARGWIRIRSVSNISVGSVQANKQQIDALMYYLEENSMDKVMVDMPSYGVHNYISVSLFRAILEGRSGAAERAKTPDFAVMQF
jgi:hypothetical protein